MAAEAAAAPPPRVASASLGARRAAAAAPRPAAAAGDSCTDVHLLAGEPAVSRAVSASGVASQLRGRFVEDLSLRFADSAGAPPPAPPPPHAAALSGVPGDKRTALAQLLAMRSSEIEAHERQKCAAAARVLTTAYQEQVSRLQAALVTQLAELGRESTRAIQAETQAFLQLGLPAIQHILSDGGLLAEAKGGGAEAHAAASAQHYEDAAEEAADGAPAAEEEPRQEAVAEPEAAV